jgi:hypothetical protein
MKRALFLAGAVTLVPAFAQAADAPLNNKQIADYFSGKTFNLGGSPAFYGKDKSYVYAGLFRGKWRATNRSMCVTFETGASRCDKIVRSGKDIIMIDAAGQRTVARGL